MNLTQMIEEVKKGNNLSQKITQNDQNYTPEEFISALEGPQTRYFKLGFDISSKINNHLNYNELSNQLNNFNPQKSTKKTQGFSYSINKSGITKTTVMFLAD